uniref:Uncharacterized protein n=1 Tax=Anguilla anguilla TaxID=7936 RepID=A0A0E9W1B3_ANGAN
MQRPFSGTNVAFFLLINVLN